MSEPTKTHLTDAVKVIIKGVRTRRFTVSKRKARGLIALLNDDETGPGEPNVPADSVFQELKIRYGNAGTTLRGFRERDQWTQVRLAAELGIRQTDVSQIENGRRPVGKKMAKRFAKVFKTDYRVFL